MRFIFLSYNYSPDIDSPSAWTERIKFYTGSLESLSRNHTVIRVDQLKYTGNFMHNGIQYYCVDDGKKQNYFPGKLNRFVKNLQPDVVVVSSFLFPLQVIQLRWCLGKKVKIILQHHAEKPYTGIRKFLQRIASNKVDACIFAAYDIGLEWMKKGALANENKIHEIVGGSSVFYPLDKITAKKRTGVEGSPVYLWAGRLNENKDPLTVIKAFIRFTVVAPAARLYMIYQSTDLLPEVLALLATENKDHCSIIRVGAVPHDGMINWFNSADFLISGSHYEGSGTVLCEAMSCGCIPIVTDIPSFSRITDQGRCGLLYQAGNVDDLFSALQESLKPEMDHKRSLSLDYFVKELSFDAIASKFQQLVTSL